MDLPRPSFGPFCLKRSLVLSVVLGLIASGAMPALAMAAHNDNFFDAIRINGRGTPLAGSFSHVHSNVGATSEPEDFVSCGDVFYGANTWYWFFPHAAGRVHVSVFAGAPAFTEPVVVMSRWTGTDTNADPVAGDTPCNGPFPGLNRTELPVVGYWPVGAGEWWAIEVAGKRTPNDETGTADTGDYELVLTYDPDSDGDGLFDSEDDCDGEPGSGNPAHRGCPDSDRDGRRNLDDRCPTLAGIEAFVGCPDADGDGVPEGGQDKCEGLRPRSVRRSDENPRDGCPDLLRIRSGLKHLLAPAGNGVRIKSGPDGFKVVNVPRGARLEMTCKRPNGSRCGRLLARRAATVSTRGKLRAQAARTVSIRRRLPNRLPYGSVITVSVTAEYAIGRYIEARIVRGGLISKRYFCIPAGKKKPRRRGGCG